MWRGHVDGIDMTPDPHRPFNGLAILSASAASKNESEIIDGLAEHGARGSRDDRACLSERGLQRVGLQCRCYLRSPVGVPAHLLAAYGMIGYMCGPARQCGRGGIGRRAALRALWARARGSSSLLDRTIVRTVGIPGSHTRPH